MLRASIDIGSNTVLLLIAKVAETELEELSSMSFVSALGRDLDKTGEFHEQSMEDTYQALEQYKKELEKFEIRPEEVIVTATEASRVANNSKMFFDQIRKQLGFQVQIISSEAEAFFTAKGVSLGAQKQSDNEDEKTGIVLDIGGASSELIKVRKKPFKFVSSVSLPLGSVRLMNWEREGRGDKDLQEILAQNKELEGYKTNRLICVAGTMTALAAMMKGLTSFESEKVNGTVLKVTQFEEFVSKIWDDSADKIRSHYPFLGKRAETIVAGSKLALKIMNALEVDEIEVSTFGLRHGTITVDSIESSYLARS